MDAKEMKQIMKESFDIYIGRLNDFHKNILDVYEVAEYLNLSPSYIRKLTSTKEIPHRKPTGKRLYFVKSEINDWIQDSKRRGQQNYIFIKFWMYVYWEFHPLILTIPKT